MRMFFGGALILFGAAMLAVILSPAGEPVYYNRAADVRAGCEREFSTVDDQRRCFTEIMVRDILQERRDSIERAAGN